MIDKNVNSPLSSSAGRLFDAVASLVLGRDEAGYEAQLPIALEKMALPGVEGRYDFDIKSRSGLLTLCAGNVIKGVVKDLSDGIDRHVISAKFHNSVASVIVNVVLRISRSRGISKVVLSGGVFQNRYLTDRVRAALQKRGLSVYTHRTTSTTDAGIPPGQIAIARSRHLCA
jgi:hydrogenase maturation protein HypF